MKKTILQVFGIIGVLVLAFLIWQLVFNDGGIIKTGYNSVANLVNTQYEKVEVTVRHCYLFGMNKVRTMQQRQAALLITVKRIGGCYTRLFLF
ncbi:MAG: hypothetical protein LBM93_01680 [Oscillospiraceae bacterium]|jgi:competence protein ComGC|nr:hypothetical protein [Oscillospiraceae bacterium]